MVTIKTPDATSFSIQVISKSAADRLSRIYEHNSINDSLLSSFQRSAYTIDNGRVLYRQLHKDLGYVFPAYHDFTSAVRGDNYWNTNIQVHGNETFVAAFALKPDKANEFRSKISTELLSYESFENNKFYQLTDDSIIMLRERTSLLSDGYWFGSLQDFDFFYYVLSGKERMITAAR